MTKAPISAPSFPNISFNLLFLRPLIMHRAEDAAFLGCATEARVVSSVHLMLLPIADCRLPIAEIATSLG
jgi:hypothetical protein